MNRSKPARLLRWAPVAIVVAIIAGPVAAATASGTGQSALPPEKAAYQRGIDKLLADQRAWLRHHSRPTEAEAKRNLANSAPATARGVGDPRYTGIREAQEIGPQPFKDLRVTNLYQGPVKDGWALVYAGAHASGGRAAVRVATSTLPSGPYTQAGTLDAPHGWAALKVVSLSRTQLTLATIDGRHRAVFNMNTRTYLLLH